MTSAMLAASVVSTSYFESMGATPIAGTLFPDAAPPKNCRVAVINDQAAELYFAGDPIGAAVIDPSGRRTTIVGVVPSIDIRATGRQTRPSIYVPFAQNSLPRMTVVMAAPHASRELLLAAKRRLSAVPGGSPPPVVRTLEEELSRTALVSERISTTLASASALMAVTLCALGMYSAMADAVRQRRREFGLRIALGAPRRHLIKEVMREGLGLAAKGAFIGWIWIVAPVGLAMVVAAASVIPSWRAVRINPLMVMGE
jgi:putative ABC transport system permease protein